jgi:hypothetical protein
MNPTQATEMDGIPPIDVVVYGIQQAGKSNASAASLEANIRHLCDIHGAPPSDADLSKALARIEEVDLLISREREAKAKADESSKRVEAEIADKRRQLEDAQEDVGAVEKGSFYVTAIIWTMLLVYLFVFYVNAAYNAFFVDPTKAKIATSAIFNPAALTEAFRSSKGYILNTYPFIFLGLGFLLHTFQKKKQYMLTGCVYLGTFLYDGLLAYEIVQKMHFVKYKKGIVTQPWEGHMAFTNMEFYLILASGFLVYLVWGFLNASLIEGAGKVFPKNNRKWLGEHLAVNRKALEELRKKSHACDEKIRALESERIGEQQKVAAHEEIKKEAHATGRHMVQGFLKGWINYICLVHSHDEGSALQRSREAVAVANKVMQAVWGSDLGSAAVLSEEQANANA